MRPLRRDHFLDRRIAREPVDRAVKIDVERDQRRKRRPLVGRAPGAQRGLQMRAPRRVNLDPRGREPSRQRVDRAAYLIELTDAPGIELRDFKTLAAAFGDQALPVQQMQRVGDGLTRHPELFRKLVLPDAVPRWQRAVRDGLKDPRIDLIDQVRGGVERDHRQFPVWNTEFRIRKLAGVGTKVKRAGSGDSLRYARARAIGGPS